MIDKQKVRKIAVVKLCCFGDIVFVTPLIKNLRFNFPAAEITLISTGWIENIIKFLPDIDRNITFEYPDDSSILKKISYGINFIKTLRKEKFDMAVLGHRTSYFGLALFLAKIKYRLGFNTTRFINYKANFLENTHEAKRYLEILKNFGLEIKYENTELKLPKLHKSDSEKFTIGIFPFGGVNPGTQMEIKRWELIKYIHLINKINENFKDIKVLLFEGITKDEKFENITIPSNVIITQINIAHIANCNIFISGDTGPLHIASALGISTLGIFGPTNPEQFAPINYTEEKRKILHRYIWKKLYCSPCYTPKTAIDKKNKKYWRGNNFICYRETNECIKSIEVEEVFFELKKIIEFLRLK